MLQIPTIRSHFEDHCNGLICRGIRDGKENLILVLELDDERKVIARKLNNLQFEQKKISKAIGEEIRKGKMEQVEGLKKSQEGIKKQVGLESDSLKRVEGRILTVLQDLPNIPSMDVPKGLTSDHNEVLKEEWGSFPKEKREAKAMHAHWDLLERMDLIDFKAGVKITGAGFPVYKGKGAQMVRGMIRYFLEYAGREGYLEVQPPYLVNPDSMFGTGQLPDKDGQMYSLEDGKYFLIPTSEVPLTNIYRDEVILDSQLPIKLCAYSPCFRREAGSWGRHVRGLNRLHQFDKVEIVQIVHPDHSWEALEDMASHVEGLLKSLELPFRKLNLCCGDLGFAACKTLDFESYAAGQKSWLEVSSVSNFGSFQTHRMKTRFKSGDATRGYPHSLNASALAIPRILATILENFFDGSSIKIPQVLHPYVGFESIEVPGA